MPKKTNYTLTESELLTIKQAIKNHEDHRVRDRARIIRLLHRGHKPKEIAELMSCSIGPIYYWHQRWRKEGLEGLEERPRNGRPKVTDEGYRQKLAQALETEPHELGFAFNVWTPEKLLVYLEKETGVKIHVNTLRNVMEEMEYVYRRPKHDLSNKQDSQAKARAVETIEILKKKPKEKKLNFSLWMKPPSD